MIDDLTLEMNRQRQAEITQEIMEVVAGAEGVRLKENISLEASTKEQKRGSRTDRGDQGRRLSTPSSRLTTCPKSTTRSRLTSSATARSRRSSARCSSTWATTACARVAMDATDGLARGVEIRDTGGPITVPGGRGGRSGASSTLLGEPIDDEGEVKFDERWPIHRDAPGRRGSDSEPGDPRDRGSRSSICWRPTRRAARSASSAAPASARRSSSRS